MHKTRCLFELVENGDSAYVRVQCDCGFDDVDGDLRLTADPYTNSLNMYKVTCPKCGNVFHSYPRIITTVYLNGKQVENL